MSSEERDQRRFNYWYALACAGFSGLISFVALWGWMLWIESSDLVMRGQSLFEYICNVSEHWGMPSILISNFIAAGVFGAALPVGQRRTMIANIIIVSCTSYFAAWWICSEFAIERDEFWWLMYLVVPWVTGGLLALMPGRVYGVRG